MSQMEMYFHGAKIGKVAIGLIAINEDNNETIRCDRCNTFRYKMSATPGPILHKCLFHSFDLFLENPRNCASCVFRAPAPIVTTVLLACDMILDKTSAATSLSLYDTSCRCNDSSLVSGDVGYLVSRISASKFI